MHLNNDKNFKENIFLAFIFLYFFLISIFQATDNHWSAIIDQDIFLIYNSLLIYSGFEQEYIDHPAFSTFFILGGIYKILSFFFNNFTLNEIINSNNIDQNFQNLFSIARFLNSIYLFVYSFLLFKILNELNIKKNLCYAGILLLLTFHSVYEILFLIRSEILSAILSLLSFYLLILFVKYKKSYIFCFFSGFFLCLAILAKVQVIFLIFILLLILPFLFPYYDYQDSNNQILKKNKFFVFSLSVLVLFFLGYIGFEFFYAFWLLTEQSLIFRYKISIPHLIDPIAYTSCILFYFLVSYYLSKKNNIKLKTLINPFEIIIYGFIFCLLFIYFLDLIKLISFNDKILFSILNPIHKMSYYGWGTFNPEATNELNFSNIIFSIKEILFSRSKLFPNESLTIQFLGIKIGILDFFRFSNVLILAILFLILVLKKGNNKNLAIIFIPFLGIAVLNLSFSVRDSLGYNIYIYPLLLIAIITCLSYLKNKYISSSFFIALFIASILEFYLLKNYYKLQFTRENRIYGICKVENWKNSENYINNHNLNSFIPLTKYPDKVLSTFSNLDQKFFDNYCGQIEKKTSWKTNFFNIIIN